MVEYYLIIIKIKPSRYHKTCFVIIDLANRNFKNLKELEINKTIPNINVYLALNKSISLTFASKKFIDYL